MQCNERLSVKSVHMSSDMIYIQQKEKKINNKGQKRVITKAQVCKSKLFDIMIIILLLMLFFLTENWFFK